ncbi:hypothetical protein EZS27_010104 [termite gut metagenome]|uniref:Uncharacterized protein n=1 Tax=termite gut metagenome TaxID=433724 RepID=A0A5J4S7K3_9ZZZZ
MIKKKDNFKLGDILHCISPDEKGNLNKRKNN